VVDSSDESGSDDGGSGLGAPVDNAVADAEVEDSSDDRFDGDSNDSSSSPGDGHLDVEAEEASDESSDQSDGNSDDSDSNRGNEFLDMEAIDSRNAPPSPIDCSPLRSFPQFVRLPLELRQRVWELFCPDLESRVTRVVPLNLTATYPGKGASPYWNFTDVNVTLQDQTRLVRAVSAVHHESRAFVLRRFPDKLPITYGFGAEAYVRFNGDKDILALQFTEPRDALDVIVDDPSISKNHEIKWVRRIAFGNCWLHQDVSTMRSVLAKFPQVETVFFWVHLADATFNARWAASPFAKRYYQQISEEIDGFQHDLDFIFCWPDFANHPDFAKYHIIPDFRDSVDEVSLELFDSQGVTLAPMLSFDLSEDIEEYERLLLENEKGIPVDQDDGVDRTDPYEHSQTGWLDEYESEGIDDAEVEDYAESSEDEVIPGPIESPDSSEAGDSGDDKEPVPAGGVEAVGGGPSRGRKRRVVSDSDDDDNGGEPAAKRIRVSNAASAAHDDGSGEHDEEGGAESNGSGEGSDESESSQSSASDDEDQPPVRLSLAERLRRFRDDNPIPSDEDSSDTAGHEEVGDEDDEDKDDEDEDGGEDERGDGFIDDMAEDSDDESDGSQESDGY
jgi:hypothetical protein